MRQLSSSDLYRVLEAVRDLHAQRDLPAFRSVLVRVMRQLITADRVSYNEMDERGRNYFTFGESESNAFQKNMPAFEAYFPEHPLFSRYRNNSASGTTKISDVVGLGAWHDNTLYQEYYRHCGVTHQIVCITSWSSGTRPALAWGRMSRDFSERERHLAEAIRPHVTQAYENLLRFGEGRRVRAVLSDALAQSQKGVISLDRRGRVAWMEGGAQHWLRLFFEKDSEGGKLPEALNCWVESQRALLAGKSLLGAPPRPLVLDHPEWRLVVQLARSSADEVVLHLTAHQTSVPASTLESIGFTPREAEVAHWMAEGKTYPEISVILGSSVRTVQKHAEHILAKLEVENRSAAAGRIVKLISREPYPGKKLSVY